MIRECPIKCESCGVWDSAPEQKPDAVLTVAGQANHDTLIRPYSYKRDILLKVRGKRWMYLLETSKSLRKKNT
jgi:hypothetical protein